MSRRRQIAGCSVLLFGWLCVAATARAADRVKAPPATEEAEDGAEPPAAPPAPVPAPAPAPDVEATPPALPGPGPHEPLAGFSGDRAFLRSPGNTFVIFPSLRLDVDAALFPRQTPKSGAFVRRANLEIAGWLGPMFYFDLAGDFAAEPPAAADPVSPSALATTDDYVAFAPAGDAFIVQAGQFDAPFSMENRTADQYTDFIERSLAVRALGVPTRKEIGLMIHGTDAQHRFYYSGGVFNGDGANFKNVDNQLDVIGRGVVAPFATSSIEPLRALTIGVSGWYGQHLSGLPFPTQTTAGGFRFFDPRWTTGRDTPTTLEVHQHGRMWAVGGEANVPLTHGIGLRGEVVLKDQVVAEDDISQAASGIITLKGNAEIKGIGLYGEVWFWLLGDERQLPPPGYELPVRLTSIPTVDAVPEQGVMIALRGEVLKEDMTSNQTVLGDPNLATTRVIAGSAALNYWYGRRVRVSMNYVLNVFGGTTESVKAIVASGALEHEVLLRFGMSL